jgi:hypothetical protein
MTNSIRALLFTLAAAIVVPVGTVRAQNSASAQPKTPFGVSDFAKLRWLEGTWEGTSPGETTIYQRDHFVNDSTLEITYYNDPALSHETGTGRVYLSVGRIYHTFGSGRWGASHIDSDGAFFIPQVNARNTFQWQPQTGDSWTSTMRTGASGHQRISVYQMKRVNRP